MPPLEVLKNSTISTLTTKEFSVKTDQEREMTTFQASEIGKQLLRTNLGKEEVQPWLQNGRIEELAAFLKGDSTLQSESLADAVQTLVSHDEILERIYLKTQIGELQWENQGSEQVPYWLEYTYTAQCGGLNLRLVHAVSSSGLAVMVGDDTEIIKFYIEGEGDQKASFTKELNKGGGWLRKRDSIAIRLVQLIKDQQHAHRQGGLQKVALAL